MAEFHGVVQVPHQTWEEFKEATMGNWYDVDGVYGAQCVDYFKLLNYNLGFNPPYAETGGYGFAYEMWTDPLSRAYNQGGGKYTLVYNLSELKKGDMVIFDKIPGYNNTGHNGILDSDFIVNPPGLTGTYAYIVGQNQRDASATYGHEVTRDLYPMKYFLGAFRNVEWNSSPTPVYRRKSHFPWYMITRKKLTRKRK